jgi:hypothetical protein
MMAVGTAYTYGDATSLARWATWLLYAQAALAAAALWSGWQEKQLLDAIATGSYQGQSAMMADADANDARQRLIGLSQTGLFLVNGVIILMWIWRANANARALGAQRMSYTPGWSVGWYFVPIANLGMPYVALKEIWKASAKPSDPEGSGGPGFWFPLWWTLWLVTNIAANVGVRLLWDATSVDSYQAGNIAFLVSDAARVPLCLVFPVIIAQVQRMQTALAAGRSGGAEGYIQRKGPGDRSPGPSCNLDRP